MEVMGVVMEGTNESEEEVEGMLGVMERKLGPGGAMEGMAEPERGGGVEGGQRRGQKKRWRRA